MAQHINRDSGVGFDCYNCSAAAVVVAVVVVVVVAGIEAGCTLA